MARARAKTFEMLWIENGTSTAPAVCSVPSISTTAMPSSPASADASEGR